MFSIAYCVFIPFSIWFIFSLFNALFSKKILNKYRWEASQVVGIEQLCIGMPGGIEADMHTSNIMFKKNANN